MQERWAVTFVKVLSQQGWRREREPCRSALRLLSLLNNPIEQVIAAADDSKIAALSCPCQPTRRQLLRPGSAGKAGKSRAFGPAFGLERRVLQPPEVTPQPEQPPQRVGCFLRTRFFHFSQLFPERTRSFPAPVPIAALPLLQFF